MLKSPICIISSYFIKFFFIPITLTAIYIPTAKAQVEKSSDLFQTLAKTDSLLFEESFNKCNHNVLNQLIADDLTFYHDESGIQKRKEFEKAIRENICSDPDHKPIRTLVDGSLHVFPLKSDGKLYGAIQKGIHEFYIKEPGKELYLTNTAEFTHVWILVDKKWKIQTVLSYNHQAPEQY